MAVQDFVGVPPVTAVHLSDDGRIPNSRFPVLIYHAAIEPGAADADAFEALFRTNGWPPAWRWTIYPFHHYHSTAHEVLGVAQGSASIMLGGRTGRTFDISAGDAVVIPAGVGHKRLRSSPDFLVVGAYPPGQSRDMLKGEVGERPRADDNIARVPLPLSDPIGGVDGLLADLWR